MPEFFLTGLNCTICSASVVIRGSGGLLFSSLFEDRLKDSWEDPSWPEVLKEGLVSFMNLGSSGGGGGGSEQVKKGGGDGKEADEPGGKGLSAVGGGGRHPSGGLPKGVRASGGGGGNTGE